MACLSNKHFSEYVICYVVLAMVGDEDAGVSCGGGGGACTTQLVRVMNFDFMCAFALTHPCLENRVTSSRFLFKAYFPTLFRKIQVTEHLMKSQLHI